MKNTEARYFCTSDTHFGHDKLIREGYKSVDDDANLLKAISKTVGDNDTLIHLGDVSFYNDEYWHEMLWKSCAGRMVLVRGNHDRRSLSWYYRNGWDFVCDEFKLDIYGEKILFTHAPAENLSFNQLGVNTADWTINAHGHWHDETYYRYKELGNIYRLVKQCNLISLRTLAGK